jgi:CheY-like chemotaxis protein/anti-sigma regulatory factor (Ser/Thr protein kinase)
MRDFYRKRGPELILAPIDLNQLVQGVIELTRSRWRDLPQERGVVIGVHTELDSALPVILGAEHEIRDALTNLIFNAIDAMPEGGTLQLRTRRSEQPSAVHLEVADTGVGMDEETRRHCLEPFFTTKGERGTGMGLAMVYGMIERHSAELEIDTAPGLGTTVRLIFSAPATVRDPAVSQPLLELPEPLRILIVDDDPLIIESLSETLRADRHQVTAAEGGQAGIDAFLLAHQQGEPFTAVITDLGMPYVDGRRVAAAIKAAAAATPVILLTGWGHRLSAENDIPEHVDRVLKKPPKLRELRLALAQLTQGPPLEGAPNRESSQTGPRPAR